MDELIFLDKELTLFFNGLHTPVLDIFFYLATSKLIWLPLYAALLWMVFSRQGGRGLMTVIVVALIVVAADQLSSGLMKPIFERLRPSHDGIMQYLVHTVNGYRGGLYGFASSHAANTFAIATFFALVVRRWSISLTLFAWAIINSYGRVYQGVHYVGDVLVGALIGILVARLFYEAYLRLVLHFFVIPHHNKWTLKNGLGQSFGTLEPRIVSYTFWVMMVVVALIISIAAKYNGITY